MVPWYKRSMYRTVDIRNYKVDELRLRPTLCRDGCRPLPRSARCCHDRERACHANVLTLHL